jgi:hypothetical protein
MTRPRIFLEVGFTKQKAGEFRQAVGERILIGRAPECAVQIDSELISREHLMLSHVDGKWVAQDLGSSNGTWFGKKRVRKGRVHVGTVLRLGPDGPRLRIVGLYPGADQPADDLEAMRLSTEAPAEPAVPEPMPYTAPAPPRALPVQRQPAAFPWPLLGGLLFGALLGLERFVESFPYEELAAPGLLAGMVVARAAPAFAAQKLALVLVVSLAAYWGLVGFTLQRPRRRWLLLAALVGSHVAVWLYVRGTLS